MVSHIKVIGVLHIVLGSLGVLVGLAFLLFFGTLAGLIGFSPDQDGTLVGPIMGSIGGLIFLVLTAISLPGIVCGIGLLQLRPWARISTIVLSVFDLLHIPFGTALGIYGLWALLAPESEALFRAPVPAMNPLPPTYLPPTQQ